MTAALDYIVAENTKNGGPFAGKLEPTKVAAITEVQNVKKPPLHDDEAALRWSLLHTVLEDHGVEGAAARPPVASGATVGDAPRNPEALPA